MPVPEPHASERDRHLNAPGRKRILALDGGGVRGILSLAYLERVETFLRARHGSDYRICDWFDLIGGTSTGSIIATGLALGMDTAALIRLYTDLSAQGFTGSRWHGGVFVPKFKAKPLMDAVRGQLGDVTLGSDRLKTGLAIVTKRIDTGSVWVFHNNPRGPYFGGDDAEAQYTPNRHLPLVELIRASTAAPTFFAPERIDVAKGVSGLFVDGGVSPHNNPALLLFMLAAINGYGFRWPTGHDNIALMSLGTGHQPMNAHAVGGLWKPSVLLAILGLRSVIEDNSWLAQTMLQWLGNCPAPWEIDGEIGDLKDDQLGPAPLLHYERYEVKFDRDWLQQKLGVSIGEKELGRYHLMDRPEMVDSLLALGRLAAKVQMPVDALV